MEKLRKELINKEVEISRLEERISQLLDTIVTQSSTISRLTIAERLTNNKVKKNVHRALENSDLIWKLTEQMNEHDKKILSLDLNTEHLSDTSDHHEERISAQSNTLTMLIHRVEQTEQTSRENTESIGGVNRRIDNQDEGLVKDRQFLDKQNSSITQVVNAVEDNRKTLGDQEDRLNVQFSQSQLLNKSLVKQNENIEELKQHSDRVQTTVSRLEQQLEEITSQVIDLVISIC